MRERSPRAIQLALNKKNRAKYIRLKYNMTPDEFQAAVHKAARDKYLRKKYGMTLEDYNKKLEAQDFRCDVCRKHQSEFTKSLAVDHNHKTGKVRGLLCSYCNHRLVGKYTLETATKIYNYLLKYEGSSNPTNEGEPNG